VYFGKMKINRGRDHVFLRMNIVYTEELTAKITMKQYLKEAINESRTNISYNATTPARKTLLNVDKHANFLLQQNAKIFHSIITKLLYVAIRARLDVLLTVGFLGTRVSKCTVEDQQKLRRLLEYIKGSTDEEYIVGTDNVAEMRTWINASFPVHPDMRSHTGGG
jgi:hypothetical protein